MSKRAKITVDDYSAVGKDVAAAIFGVSGKTIDNWRKKNGAPCHGKVGNKILFDIPKLIAWREERARSEQVSDYDDEVTRALEEEMKAAGIDSLDLDDADDPFLSGPGIKSVYQEKARKQTARKLKIDNDIKLKSLIDKKEVDETYRNIILLFAAAGKRSHRILPSNLKTKFAKKWNSEVDEIKKKLSCDIVD